MRNADEQRSAATQLFFEKIRRGARLIGLERIRADDFGEVVGLMSGSRPRGTHLVQANFYPALGGLPGGFGARETSADDWYLRLIVH
jgi:hypothetical protein